MPGISSERAHDVREALRTIVADPEHGGGALSNPNMMSNLLKDLLPDAPRETNLLVAAAEANLSGMMRDQVAQGIDAGSAIRLAAASLSATTHFTDTACTWVATELAAALGFGAGFTEAGDALPPGEITKRTFEPTRLASEPTVTGRPAVAPGLPVSLGAILVLVGAVALLLAYEFPVVYDPQPVRVLTTLPFWMASIPLIALVATVIAGALLLRKRGAPIWHSAAGAVAAVSGIELLLFFVAVNDKFVSSYGDRRGIGLVIGLLSALLLAAGGFVELRRQARLSRAPR
jgi:hypothetical protein